MSVERDVDIYLDDGNAAVATTVEVRELRLDDLFQDGELRLWEDESGWNGFLREGDGDDAVYYSVNCSPEFEDKWVRKVRVGEQAVRKGIKQHIADPKAGEAGEFRRRCLPP